MKDINNRVRVRFAPSPTGEMHIGNLRTAIFNWIFAKQQNGKFFIRIEDTDKTRSTEEYKNQIFEILKEMNIDFNLYDNEIIGSINGIVTQSKRYDIYKKYVNKLLEKKHAFFCQCSLEEEICHCLTKEYNYGAVRYKTPKNIILSFNDMVFGELQINTNNIENFVIWRSDESPTYMLSVVVDDIEMSISHIIRGEDHKTNTFKQMLLYESFGEKHPIFAHLPMIIGEDGKKLSKRNGNTNVRYYLDQGYLPDALFNIFLKLGWGFGNEEIISKEKIIEIFKFSDVKKSAARFDEKKLINFSGKYLKMHNYSDLVKKYIYKKYKVSSDLIDILYFEVSKRSNTLNDFYNQIDFLWHKPIEKHKIDNNIIEILKNINIWKKDNIYNEIKDFCISKNIETKEVVRLLRLNITGKEFSPDIFFIFQTLGKDYILNNLS